MSTRDPVAVQLTRIGAENDPNAKAVVDIELADGRCFRIIEELVGSNFSHSVNLVHDVIPSCWKPIPHRGS